MDSNSAAQVSTSLIRPAPKPFAQFSHPTRAFVAFELPLGRDALVAQPQPFEPATVSALYLRSRLRDGRTAPA